MRKAIAAAAFLAILLPAITRAGADNANTMPSRANPAYEAVAFCGPIIAVDAANKRFTCIGDDGPLTLTVNAQTRIKGGKGDFASIKRGVRVDLHYRCSGDACIALDVEVNN